MRIKTSHAQVPTRSARVVEPTRPDSEKNTVSQDRVTADNFEPGQAERITNFVAEAKVEGAKKLQQGAALMAGQLTGMTLGSMIFAPIAFQIGNLYVATGGAALAGGALALLASHLAGKDDGQAQSSKLLDGSLLGATALKALPKIAYPTVVGATAAEKAMVYGALDKLPLSGVTSAPTIDMVTGLEKAGASGLATPLFSQSRIFLDKDQMALGHAWGQEVTTHEIGHTYDFSKGVGPIFNRSHRGGGFGKEPFISDYANTNRMEDYAESYATYHSDPEQLLERAPEKFAKIDASQQPGVVDAALDRPSVRDTGRKIGTAFEKAPRLRNLLALGSSLVGPVQLYRGAKGYANAVKTDDAEGRYQAKMKLATGAALFTPAGAALSVALAADNVFTGKRLADGSITAEQAEKRADNILKVATGPFGFVAGSLEGKLDDAGLITKPSADFLSKSEKYGALPRSGVTPLSVGFAGGAVLGGLVAPLLTNGATGIVSAAAAGTWIGGALGAAALFVADHVKQGDLSTFGLKNVSQLKGQDKAMLAKLATPTVVGGTAGAFLGYTAGGALGEAVGQSLGGAVGGVTGGALGRYLGMLGGSYALAEGGAKLGATWAGLSVKEGA